MVHTWTEEADGYDYGDRLERGEIGYLVKAPVTYAGKQLVDCSFEIGQPMYVRMFDSSDDSYQVGSNEIGIGETRWVDASCISIENPYKPVTDQEMAEVYKILGVSRE